MSDKKHPGPGQKKITVPVRGVFCPELPHNRNSYGAFSGSDLIEIGKIDAAKLAELKVSVNDRYGYGTSQENGAQVSIGV